MESIRRRRQGETLLRLDSKAPRNREANALEEGHVLTVGYSLAYIGSRNACTWPKRALMLAEGPSHARSPVGTMSVDAKTSAARTFVRSLNILLKLARLYEFGHKRTGAQFETAWHELRAAFEQNKQSGLLLGASGNQILVDGVPLEGGAAERTFAHLLSASGIASIHFSPKMTQAQFAKFVRAFPTGNAKPSALAEQLKTALAGETGIRINEIRYVAEDESVAGIKVAAQLTAKVLGGTSAGVRDILEDPQKLLQLILAAEGSRSGAVQPSVPDSGPGGGAASGPGGGLAGGVGIGGFPAGRPTAGGLGRGTESGASGGGYPAENPGSLSYRMPRGLSGAAERNAEFPPGDIGQGGRPGVGGVLDGGTAAGIAGGEGSPRPGRWLSASSMLRSALNEGKQAAVPASPLADPLGKPLGAGFFVAEEDVRSMLSLFGQLGRARRDPEAKLDLPTFQARLSTLPVRAQFTLQQALAGLAMQAPAETPDKPLLLRLAEHVAIRFALDSYERGEVRVNAVRQMLDRLNQEVEALRKILASHESLLAGAGIQVEAYTELLDQEFWEQVPEDNKRQVLTSPEAWCVPPKNVRSFLEDLLRRGELKVAHQILINYVSCIGESQDDARRTTAMGLADLAEFYASGDGGVLMEAVRRVGIQLAQESDPGIQTLVSAAFVRLSQEAAARRYYPAMLQSLASLETAEERRLGSTQGLAPRIGVEERLPEFIEDALRTHAIGDGLIDILRLLPGPTLKCLGLRYSHCGFRDDCQLLCEVAQGLGQEAQASLITTLQSAPAAEAAETVGLLSRLSPKALEKMLPQRLSQWPRVMHDRAVRQLSAVEPEIRARLLLAIYDSLDPLIHPLALDEMGASGDPQCIPKLVSLVSSEDANGYHRLKAIEALCRLRAQPATALLQRVVDTRQVWRWVYPIELRIAAIQALVRIDPPLGVERLAASRLDRQDLIFEPLDPDPHSTCIRQRRYARLKLSRTLAGVTTNLRDNLKMTFPELNLGGGLAICDRHLAPGALLALKIKHGVRSISAQVMVRGVRPQAIAFEIVDMDLEQRWRLRKLLLEVGGPQLPSVVGNRSRRHLLGMLVGKG